MQLAVHAQDLLILSVLPVVLTTICIAQLVVFIVQLAIIKILLNVKNAMMPARYLL